MTALSMLGYLSSGARKRPPSSLSIRHVLRCAMACSTAARILLSDVLNSTWSALRSMPGKSLVRDGVDSLDTDVAQIGHRGVVGESLGQPGCFEGVRVVAGALHRDRADRGELAVEGGRDLQVHARISGLG